MAVDDEGEELGRRIRSLEMHENEFGVDPFGLSRRHIASAMPFVHALYRYYFRTEVFGIQQVPTRGRLLLVANHGGALPFDGLVVVSSMLFEPDPPRLVRSMVENFVPSMPFASYLMPRWGQILGTPENCRRLLEQEEAILVFPEGARGVGKPFSKRYQLEPFGHGFMRLALETHAPIVPVAVIGAEEQTIAINAKPLAKAFGLPSFPIAPYPPFVPLPLPVKYRLHFGEPMHFAGDPDDDEDVIEEKVRAVRHRVQSLIHVGLRGRKHVFW